MKTFCFTVDDNIRFLKEITERAYESIFEHPYLAMYRRLHEAYGLKVQLNLFYRMEGFDLSQTTAAHTREWMENADWLKLSFHSLFENVSPYEFSGYDEVFCDCEAVHREILRFAATESLAKTTTLHYCLATEEGLRAMKDHDVCGLLGLFGTGAAPRTSYGIEEETAGRIREGEIVKRNGIAFAPIDVVLNQFSAEKILKKLSARCHRETLWVMIHEQYFYEDYGAYQPDFEEKLDRTFRFLRDHGYQSAFFEDVCSASAYE